MSGNIPASGLHALFRNRSRIAPPAAARLEFGFIYVLTVPIIAVLANAAEMKIAGFAYTGWLWCGCLLSGLFVLLYKLIVYRSEKTTFPYVAWLIWFGYVWTSLVWADSPGRVNVQTAVQVTMPLLIGVIASAYVRTEARLQLLLRIFCYSLIPAYVIVAAAKLHLVPSLDSENPDDPLGTMAPLGMLMALISCVFLVQIGRHPVRAWLGWGAALILSFLTGARTVTGTMLLLPIFNPSIKRVSTRVILVVVASTVGLILFHTPWFQTRFFYDGHGTLGDIFNGEFDSSGRFDAWPFFWDEAWHHPIFGAGVGAVMTARQVAWTDGHTIQVHNDYLAIFFEYGLVGLTLFVAAMGLQTVRLFREMTRAQGIARQVFAAAFMGMWVFALNACTDNPLAYNLWFTDPLFALIGGAYGVAYAAQRSAPESDLHSDIRSDYLADRRNFSLLS